MCVVGAEAEVGQPTTKRCRGGCGRFTDSTHSASELEMEMNCFAARSRAAPARCCCATPCSAAPASSYYLLFSCSDAVLPQVPRHARPVHVSVSLLLLVTTPSLTNTAFTGCGSASRVSLKYFPSCTTYGQKAGPWFGTPAAWAT